MVLTNSAHGQAAHKISNALVKIKNASPYSKQFRCKNQTRKQTDPKKGRQ